MKLNKFKYSMLVGFVLSANSYAWSDEFTSPPQTYDEAIKIKEKIDQLESMQFSEGQVKTIKKALIGQELARSTPYTSVAIPVTRSLSIKFDAGLTPPIIRLSANMLTTLVFSDGLGNPWNIENVSINKKLFRIDTNQETSKSSAQTSTNADTANTSTRVANILSIEPLTAVAYSNLVVTLDGLDKPIILMLTTGQSEVDMRVDTRISGVNPNKQTNTSGSTFLHNTTPTLDDSILLFVDGTPPDSATAMRVDSNNIQAWIYNDQLIVRTSNNLIYPAFKSSSKSSSGVMVYKFDPDVSDIIVSDAYGKPLAIHIDLP